MNSLIAIPEEAECLALLKKVLRAGSHCTALSNGMEGWPIHWA